MTIKELASIAGVSISTVSKIMNQKDASISDSTREKVLALAKEYHYTPYSNAHTFSKSFVIGVLLRSSIRNMSINGIVETARSLGYTVLTSVSACDPELEKKELTTLCHHGIDGLLWEPVSEKSLQYRNQLQGLDIPYLLFNSNAVESSFTIDFETIAYHAVKSLIDLGHRDIACLTSTGTRTKRCINGFRKCLFDMGIPYHESMLFSEAGTALTQKISTHAVTGVFCTHFSCALELYGKLNSLQYNIPYDVSLVSLKDDGRKKTDFPQISTYTIPNYTFGVHLCHALVNIIEQTGNQPDSFLQTPPLDNRQTLDIPITRRTKKIIVAGSINIDNYLKVEQLPTSGKSILSSSAALYPGGKGTNQAIGAAKLGAQVALLGNVGDDIDSDRIYSALREHSINYTGVRRCSKTDTGKAYIFVRGDGQSLICISPGANTLFSAKDIQENRRLFENSSYCLVQTEIPVDTVTAVCKMARQYHVKTILKPSACSSLSPELLPYIDILVPNCDEANELCPSNDIREQASYFLSKGISAVIITLGADGCYVRTPDMELRLPSISFPSVDHTGASDAFISALAVFLQDGYPLAKAARIASYAAGFSISREGVPPSLIDKNTLISYISRKEPDLLKKESDA